MDLCGNFQHNNIPPIIKQTFNGHLVYPHFSSWEGERIVSTVNRDRFCYYIRPQNISADQKKVIRRANKSAIRPYERSSDHKSNNSFLKENCSNNGISDASNSIIPSNVKEKKIYSMKINTRQSLKSGSKINTRQSLKFGSKINLKHLASSCAKNNKKCKPHANATPSKKGYLKKLTTKQLNNCDNQSLLIENDPKLKQNCVVVLEKIIFHNLESKLNFKLHGRQTLNLEPKLGLRRKNSEIPIKMNLRKNLFNRTLLKKKPNGRENLSSNSLLNKSLKCNISPNSLRIENSLSLQSPNPRSGLRSSRLQSELEVGVPKKSSQITKMPKEDISLDSVKRHQITSYEKTKIHDTSITRTSLRIRNICKNIPREISPHKNANTYNLNKTHTLELKNDCKSISPVKKILSQENKLPEKTGNSKYDQFRTSTAESKRTREKDKISQKENIKKKVLIQIFSPQGEINLEVLSPNCSRGKNNRFKLGERKSVRHSKLGREHSVRLSDVSTEIDNKSENSYNYLDSKSVASNHSAKQTRSVASKKNPSSQKVNVSGKFESKQCEVKAKRKSNRKVSKVEIKNNLPENSPTLSDHVDANSPRFFNENIQDQQKQRTLRSSRNSLIEQHICYLSNHENSLKTSVTEKLNSSLSSPNSALLLHIKTPEKTILKEVKHDKSDSLQDQSILKEIKHRKVSEFLSPLPLKNQNHKNSNINDDSDLLLSNDKATKPKLRLSSKRLSQGILKRQNQNDSDVIDKCDSPLFNDKVTKPYLITPVKKQNQIDFDVNDKCDLLLSNDKATKPYLISSAKRLSREVVKKQNPANFSIEHKTPVKRQKRDSSNIVSDQLLLSKEKVMKPKHKTPVKGQKHNNSVIYDECDLLLSNDKGMKPKFKTMIKRQKHNDSDFVDGECDLLLSNDKVLKPKPKLSHSSSVKKVLVKPKKKRSKSEGPIRKQDSKKNKKILTPNVLLKNDKSKDKNNNADICILSSSKQPSKGSMKRKQWFVEKLNKHSEGHEDDIFEAKEFEIAEELFAEDSDSSELYQHMLTPKREFTLVPQNGKVPGYDPCPSPVDMSATTRKEADEYLYRRIKRQKNKVAEEKQNPVVQTFEEKQAELDIEKILQDVKKLNKPKKRKRESETLDEEEDFYFSDISEDSVGSFIND